MKKKTIAQQEHEDELDRYFDSVNQSMQVAKQNLQMATGPVGAHPKTENQVSVNKAHVLKLMDMCMTTKWEKVPEDVRVQVVREPNVMRTEWVMDGKLSVPLAKRTALTAEFYMHKLRQEGHFSQLQDAQLYQHDDGVLYLLCVSMSRRVDADSVLTGNYVFRILNPAKKWTQDNFETKARFADGICKTLTDDFEIMQETVVLQNFFFALKQHHVSQPLFSVA